VCQLIIPTVHIPTIALPFSALGSQPGNFNSDNCLVAGRTMDYGPFGFIEKFDPVSVIIDLELQVK
jgi:uncharacterized protein YdiU (UPF0061 family)